MSAKSVTRTIRVANEIDDFLREFAEKEGVSVNFLVNRSLRKFVDWDIYAEKFGIVSLPGSLIDRMMDYLDEDQARELGRWVGRNSIREFITFWFKEVSLRTVVKGYPRLAAQYGRAFEYDEHVENGRWVIILKHGKGHKWSVYYEELLRALFEDILKKETKVETTQDLVVVRFSVS